MADQNEAQPGRIGVVGQPSQSQATQNTQPQRGVPGTQQPPVPSAEQIQRVMAEQARQRQTDAAEAQRRAAELAKTAVPGQGVHGMELPNPPGISPAQQQIPPGITAQMPPQMQQPQVQSSPPQDMSPAQVFAGIPQDQRAPMQQPPAQPQGNQFAQFAQPQPVKKAEVPWYPIRSAGVDVELEDSIIKFVPAEGIAAEGNAQAKVILALFSEVLFLRGQIQQLAQAPAVDQGLANRVYQLERVLFEQRQSMSSRARSVKEQVELLQSKGLTPEQVVAALSDQSQAAAEMVAGGAPGAPGSPPE